MSIHPRFAMSLVAACLAAAPPVSAQNPWRVYEFTGTESFQYEIRHQADGVTQEGTFSMSLTSGGAQPMASVEAALGDASCSATMPLSTPQAIMPQMMMQCMVVAPVAMAMFTPVWAMFMGQSLEIGSRMTMSQGDESFSFEVTGPCSHAGVDGVLAEVRAGDAEIDTCVATDVPLPLAVQMRNANEGESIDVVLTRFSR